jgi:hypothetical protein
MIERKAMKIVRPCSRSSMAVRVMVVAMTEAARMVRVPAEQAFQVSMLKIPRRFHGIWTYTAGT